MKFVPILYSYGKFVTKNLKGGLLRDMFTDDSIEESKLTKSHYEVLQSYISLYNNLEIRVNDYINGKHLSPEDALDVLASYAIANEGTNTLYSGLTEVLC
jgi:hypothetical protein